MTAATLLELARQPAAWTPSWDRAPRWRLDHYARRADISAGAAGFAAVLVCAMNADGALPAHVDRDELCRRARCSWRSFARWCAELESARLIRRVYRVTIAGPGDWRREVTIRPAQRLEKPCTPRASDLRMRHSVSPLPHKSSDRRSPRVDVRSYLTGRNARERPDPGRQPDDLIEPWQQVTDRQFAAKHWHLLARARSDLPSQRPCADQFSRFDITCVHCGQAGHTGAMCTLPVSAEPGRVF